MPGWVPELLAALAVLSCFWAAYSWAARRSRRLAERFASLKPRAGVSAAAKPRRARRVQDPLPLPFRWLERRAREAGVRVDLATVLVLVLGSALGLWLLGEAVFGEGRWALVCALGGLYAPVWWLGREAERRAERAVGQVAELAGMVVRGMRAGMTLLQVLEEASQRVEDPLGYELGLAVAAVRGTGVPLSEALRRLDESVRLPELRILTAAMRVHLDTGSNLAEIAERVARTIDERRELRAAVRAATSSQRGQANLIMAIPFVMIMLFRFTNPDYLWPLFHTAAGQVVFAACLLTIVAGRLVIARIGAVATGEGG